MLGRIGRSTENLARDIGSKNVSSVDSARVGGQRTFGDGTRFFPPPPVYVAIGCFQRFTISISLLSSVGVEIPFASSTPAL